MLFSDKMQNFVEFRNTFSSLPNPEEAEEAGVPETFENNASQRRVVSHCVNSPAR